LGHGVWLNESDLDRAGPDLEREMLSQRLGIERLTGLRIVAEEGGDVFGFDSEDGLPGKLLIEGFEDGWRAEHQIRGVSTCMKLQ
jgi:hypothetical protein